ncbi:MAG: penicillin acylase family protein [Acidimicrobiia bacterium]|nr:penicillin acylase family protein [Acidimicrobiia bacterium]
MVATLLPVCWSPLGAAPARRGPLGHAPLERSVYRASVVRTPYGIPHVRAADWGSLGYGYGYAFSQDNFCELAKDGPCPVEWWK